MNVLNDYVDLIRYLRSIDNDESVIEQSKLQAINKAKQEEERIKSICEMELPMDFENVFNSDESICEIKGASIKDGLIMSLNKFAGVDLEYIAKVTGYSFKEIINELKGVIYCNPALWNETFYKGWEMKDAYLTGNIRDKYQQAKLANLKYHGFFDENLKALEEICSNIEYIKGDEIYISLGSPWLEIDIVKEFIKHLLKVRNPIVSHDLNTGSWSIVKSSNFGDRYLMTKTYGTSYFNGLEIIEKMLNQTEIVARDKGRDNKYTKNEKETLLLLEKQSLINEEFHKWIYSNDKRKTQIVELYNRIYCNNYIRHYDGSFLSLPDKNPNIEIFDYQKNAIARVIFSPNTLLAHDVGSGKTYEMICAGHELKRMKLRKKILYVVPNSILPQWETIYKELYPQCNILVINPKKFTKTNRFNVLNDIRYNDYDAIIMAYSSFDMIDLSPEYYQQLMQAELQKLENANNNPNKRTSVVSRRVTLYQKDKYGRYAPFLKPREKDMIYFDELGIDQLFIDEAHNYKNCSLDTIVQAVGINSVQSRKCDSLMDKVHYIQKNNCGKGICFATGTPITNSLTDVYVMQKYLQEGELELMNLNSFNSWISNFAEKENVVEIDIDTSKYRIRSRYVKFHNLPELTSLLANIADFHHVDKDKDLPDFNGYEDIIVNRTRAFEHFLEDVSKRADLIRSRKPRIIHEGKTKEETVYDNFLLLTHDGRSAALDIRLINDKEKFSQDSKVQVCAEKVFENYQNTTSFKGTQLIFCDVSTPKDKFNIYDELRRILENMGIPANEIAYIHDADSDKKREALFKAVNSGKVRVLIGSTFKLGLGVNVQERLYAIHHIDVPWRPADMIQREGRILRPGNTNKEIFIYRYIVEKSFDAYSWQIIESKQNFISTILNNSVDKRDGNDVDDAVLNYAEIKALAIGNEDMKERTLVYNDLHRLKNLRNKELEMINKSKFEIEQMDKTLPIFKEQLEKMKEDLDYLKTTNIVELLKNNRKEYRELFFKSLNEHFNNENPYLITNLGEFSIYVPANLIEENNDNLKLMIGRNRTYDLKILNNLNGIITRVENFFEDFEKSYNDSIKKYDNENQYYKSLVKGINKRSLYQEDIERLQNRLNEIDKKLGIDLTN